MFLSRNGFGFSSERLPPIAAAGQNSTSPCGRSFVLRHWVLLADLLPMGVGLPDQVILIAFIPERQGIDVLVLQKEQELAVDNLEVRRVDRELVADGHSEGADPQLPGTPLALHGWICSR